MKELILTGFCAGLLVMLGISLFPKTEVFEYNGHEYIQFTKGVVHSPDCKYCLSKYD